MHADPAIRPDATKLDIEVFTLPPHDWVPNNRKLPVVLYRRALAAQGDTYADGDELAAAFEALFDEHQWPPRWRDSIFEIPISIRPRTKCSRRSRAKRT